MSKLDFDRLIHRNFEIGEIIEVQDQHGGWYPAKVVRMIHEDPLYSDGLHFYAPIYDCRKYLKIISKFIISF